MSPSATDTSEWVRASAPGRVNLIGDHTDYMGGFVLPMAIQFRTTVSGRSGGDRIALESDAAPGAVSIDLPVTNPTAVEPAWGRYVAGVAAELDAAGAPASRLGRAAGLVGSVASTIPSGAGLSSSAALSVAVALALGDTGSPAELARRCQAAEQRASGVPCGIMDQLASTAGRAGHALLIDCAAVDGGARHGGTDDGGTDHGGADHGGPNRIGGVEYVPLPDDLAVWVVHSGVERRLADSAYAQRRMQCETAERRLGPLRDAEPGAIEAIQDPLIRARARHVRSECDRVVAFATALRSGDATAAGELMVASHASLRDDFEVSVPALDELVAQLTGRPDVHGARLTGAGFGGCVVALTTPRARLDGWRVEASDGARLEAT